MPRFARTRLSLVLLTVSSIALPIALHATGHVRDASFVDPFLKRLRDESLTDQSNFLLSAPTLDAMAVLR